MTGKKGLRSIIDHFEKNFAAAGLAEGDQSVAREYLEAVEGKSESSLVKNALDKIKEMLLIFENSFAAAAMAEGGPELAVEYLENREPSTAGPSFSSFIKDIGLQGIRVQYGVATI